MDPEGPRAQLTVHRVTDLDAARQALLHQFAAAGVCLHERTVFAFELVLEEWLVNAIGHGGASRVDVIAQVHGPTLTLRFVDDGAPFDPTTRVAPPPARSLEEAEPGGFGLNLMQRHSLRWRHRRLAEGNELTVEIAVPTAP